MQEKGTEESHVTENENPRNTVVQQNLKASSSNWNKYSEGSRKYFSKKTAEGELMYLTG